MKLTALSGVAFAAGCDSHPEKNLFGPVHAPEDMVAGAPLLYASTCRECPAGCGILAINREGRVIKLEGNPLHPVNRGRLCGRGQAALQGVYHPDRIKTPLLKTDGRWKPISFPNALKRLREASANAAGKGPGRIGMLTEPTGDDLLALFQRVLLEHRSPSPLVFEPLAYDSLKAAEQALFGESILPVWQLEKADMLLAFGADFLETWLSPVEYCRRFKEMHALRNGRKGRYAHIAPFQSLTAANADQWIPCRPGGEVYAALGLIHLALKGGRGDGLPAAVKEPLRRLAQRWDPGTAARMADLPVQDLEAVARALMTAERPLVLPTSAASLGLPSMAADLAVLLLNAVLDPSLARLDFDRRHRVEIAAGRAAVAAFWENAPNGGHDLILLNNVDPVYGLPQGGRIAEKLKTAETLVVAFTNFMTDTAQAADLVFPTALPLEAWDAFESRRGMTSILQPAMGSLTGAPHIGDIFLNLLPEAGRPAPGFRAYLAGRIRRRHDLPSEAAWLSAVRQGGCYGESDGLSGRRIKLDPEGVAALSGLLDRLPAPAEDRFVLAAPSLRFFDGRAANRPWLAETPDPITQVAWQTVALLPPDLMKENRWRDGQVVRLATAHGKATLPAYRHDGLHGKAVVIPLGQGHRHFGRYAGGQGVNPLALLNPDSGHPAPVYGTRLAHVTATGRTQPLASASGSRVQYGRKIALSVPLAKAGRRPEKGGGLAMGDFPLTLPLPEGYDHHRDVYPPHEHQGYRWGMVVDLDRCTGCSACVAACYAENNIGVVGEDRMIEGREMAWMRIERYQDETDPSRLIFLPMMCQHCENAPCESVCPVYAPHHGREGLNNQIYNRCIGTRFCAQNCPYKVRRFNWFDWEWPRPLNLQLNPNVTVRSKGVMEKCSFCVQRIKAAHDTAKNEGRAIRDGEVAPACVETCPTEAIVFGNLMDPDSRVRRLMDDPRAYQVMGYLNTKPAVVYLKKVVQTL